MANPKSTLFILYVSYVKIDRYTLILKTKTLPSMQHFAWKIILNKVVTKENLICKKIMIENIPYMYYV